MKMIITRNSSGRLTTGRAARGQAPEESHKELPHMSETLNANARVILDVLCAAKNHPSAYP